MEEHRGHDLSIGVGSREHRGQSAGHYRVCADQQLAAAQDGDQRLGYRRARICGGITDVSAGYLGTLYTNTTFSGNVTLQGDVTVASGVTLTVNAGTTVTAAGSDAMIAGGDTSHIELIVVGSLAVQGTSGSPITMHTASGSWYGIRVNTGGTLTLSNTTLTNGINTLDLAGTATLTNDTVSGVDCVMVSGGTTSINGLTAGPCTSTGLAVSAGTVTATQALFSQSQTGLYASGGTLAIDHSLFVNGGVGVSISGVQPTLDHLTIANNSSHGVYAYFTAQNLAINLTSSLVVSNGGYGLWGQQYYSGSLTCTACDVWNNTGGTTYQYASAPSNANTNPDFVGGTNYHLASNSPVRGIGQNSSDMGAYPYAPGPLDHLTLTPSPGSVAAGGAIGFSAGAFDAQGNAISTTITWTAKSAAGSIDQNGTLTASCTTGTVTNGVTVSATVGSVTKTASANVTISAGTLSQITVSPTSPSVSAGASQTFTATANDTCGNTVTAPITWTVSAPAAGSINSSTGVYGAPCTPGNFANAVIATSGSVHGSTTITVVAGGPSR